MREHGDQDPTSDDRSEGVSPDFATAEQPGTPLSNDREGGATADAESGAPIDISMA